MNEDQKRSWDVGLGIAAPIITVVGLLVGVWQFNVGESNRVTLENELLVRKDTIEFHRKLWLDKLNTYRKLVVLAGRIAAMVNDANGNHSKLDPLATDLTAAYWVQTVFVEDPDVADALRDFYQAVRDYQSGLAGDLAADKKVKLSADHLAEACKASINRDAPPGGVR